MIPGLSFVRFRFRDSLQGIDPPMAQGPTEIIPGKRVVKIMRYFAEGNVKEEKGGQIIPVWQIVP